MSPKRYKKALKNNQAYEKQIHKLKEYLKSKAKKYKDISSEDVLEMALEIISDDNR